MKKYFLILSLLSIFGFATTGNFNIGFKSDFNFNKSIKHEYSLPYSLKVKMDKIPTLYLGIDGVYNKEKPFGSFDIIGNEASGWAKYTLFENQPLQYDFYLKNTLNTKLSPLSIDFKTLFNFQFSGVINEYFKYVGLVEYEGNIAILNPNHFSFKNKLILLNDNVEFNTNFRADFSGKTHVFAPDSSLLYKDAVNKNSFSLKDDFKTHKYLLDSNLVYSDKGFTVDTGLNYTYASSLKLRTDTSANEGEEDKDIQSKILVATKQSNEDKYHELKLFLNLNYTNDFKVIRLKTDLNNKIQFGILNNESILYATTDTIVDGKIAPTRAVRTIYTLSPSFLIDREFKLSGIDITPHIGSKGNLYVGLGDTTEVYGDLTLLFGFKSVAHMTDTIDLRIGFDVDPVFKKHLEKFEFDKVHLGANVDLGFRW